MKAIGGYFEIETEGTGTFPHKDGILLNTGRNALEYILRSIQNIKRIYLPYYTCEVVLEPIEKLHIPYSFYHIDHNFEIAENIVLNDGEYLIANNYFGIKDAYIQHLADYYKERLIVDCAQSFFAPVITGVKMFYSPRKFLGVPDGGVAYGVDFRPADSYEKDDSSGRLEHLYIRKEKGAEAGFMLYRENEKKLDNQPIRRMSCSTRNKLLNIDYTSIVRQRRVNFKYLHSLLRATNDLNLPDANEVGCPMLYPYLTKNGESLRKQLISDKIFVATYWPNVFDWTAQGMLENVFAKNLLAIPCDQRYGKDDMNRILKVIER